MNICHYFKGHTVFVAFGYMESKTFSTILNKLRKKCNSPKNKYPGDNLQCSNNISVFEYSSNSGFQLEIVKKVIMSYLHKRIEIIFLISFTSPNAIYEVVRKKEETF